MSDTTNRDIGRKRQYQRRVKGKCQCWGYNYEYEIIDYD